MVDPIFDYQFRLILIGDSTVGKSSLLKYFTDGKFAELSDPTVGVDFFARLIEVKDGTRIKLQLWDTAGQERFRSITKSYYRNSVGALLVYDVCNRSSFEHIPLWMMEAKRHIEPHRPVFALVGCKVDLVGSGSKNGARREVSCEEARAFAERNAAELLFIFIQPSKVLGEKCRSGLAHLAQYLEPPLRSTIITLPLPAFGTKVINIGLVAVKRLHHVETSAKTGQNVEEAFTVVTEEVYNRIQTGEYKVEDGWDGIKTGFNRPNGLMDFNLIEAEPAKSHCC